MTNYKDTLNLPKTDFPMRANLAQREPGLLKRWQDASLYEQLVAHWAGRPQFVLHDGPPYANGNLHLGHALNKVLKDTVNKSKMLSGYATPYVPGWDCHGLPIELNVEKKKGKPGHKIDAATFRQACRDYAARFVDIQREEFKRLGVLGQWDKPYLTMDFQYEANIIRALGKVIKAGVVKQGYKPVYWCFDCGSALAQAEVEYQDKISPSIYVRFKAVDEAGLLQAMGADEAGQGPLSVPIWTTTPWTLPANEAVCLHPNLTYVLVQLANERIILAEELLTTTLAACGIEDYTILAQCQGEVLEKQRLWHPLTEREVPLVLGHHVTTETGTGAVHTAPAHGPDDYQVGRQYQLPMNNLVLGNGCFIEDLPDFGGQHVYKANQAIMDYLTEQGLLLAADKINHSYPHCWRHKTPLIFRATPQWFISMEQGDLRQHALAEIEKVNWLPPQGQARISTMVENNPDWCISRQRTWGVPIPVFLHKATSAPHPQTVELINQVADLVAEKGIDAWYELDAQTLIGDDAEHYEKGYDVLDVWFDSGVTHFCVLAQSDNLPYPADIYLEGSDQHRGWFQSSLLSAVAMNGEAPYKTVLTHGFTVDEKGHKMSKSLGNTILPEKVIKQYGADILRLWIASTDYRGEITCSNEFFKRTADTYRRIRNTVRYLLANICDFDIQSDEVAHDDLLALDQWVLASAKQVQETVIAAYDDYQFHVVCQSVHHFCAMTLGGFYLDIIKDRIYTMPTTALARRSAQTVIYHILQALLRWLAPILSFTAEEAWGFLPNNEHDSIFFSTWYDGLLPLNDNSGLTDDDWQKVINVRDTVNKALEQARSDNKIGSALDAEVVLYANDDLQAVLALLNDELRFVLITSNASVKSLADAPATAIGSDDTVKVEVVASTFEKCVRCWHHREDVGSDAQHPELCSRCIGNISEQVEQRCYA